MSSRIRKLAISKFANWALCLRYVAG